MENIIKREFSNKKKQRRKIRFGNNKPKYLGIELNCWTKLNNLDNYTNWSRIKGKNCLKELDLNGLK